MQQAFKQYSQATNRHVGYVTERSGLENVTSRVALRVAVQAVTCVAPARVGHRTLELQRSSLPSCVTATRRV